MERKRKLPARAAARVEQVAKRRQSTPRERSETPAPVVEEPPPPPPLPKSVQPGKPLPTVEDPQPSDLSSKEYQSVVESGVLVESLSRSRQKWMHDGLFEKYWTKPYKRKGVVNEDPKNPPKDSMTKIGTVTITIEPHIVEATMYAVKDPKPRSQPQQHTSSQPPVRPIIQYGPPNGTMPPPAPIKSAASSPMPDSAQPRPAVASPAQPASLPQPTALPRQAPAPNEGSRASASPSVAHSTPSPGLSYPPRPPSLPATASPAPGPPRSLTPSSGPRPPSNPGHLAAPAQAPPPVQPINPAARTSQLPVNPATTTARPAIPNKPPALGQPAAPGTKGTTTDPVIALLAQKASGDAELRDLMKRVAVGQAKEGELQHFQKIIDGLNAEYKRSGGVQGPSADRLLVDGRTVKYFASEVRTILDIVLASNPGQRSTDLRPPPRSDPLVVLLVKKALEDQKTKDMIKNIADGKPGPKDATDLKEILDKLHKDAKGTPKNSPVASQAKPSLPATAPNGMPNGSTRSITSYPLPQQNPQALRSKGPPPKPDISAVVFDFGSGDRYLFPKFSILEFQPTTGGQQVVASFLIVRKGSTSEYASDPKLDYYQPVSMRLQTQTGRYLENLVKVVAPQEEVRRYMDDVMDNMTRAEYILLAMRLPRAPREGDQDDNVPVEHDESKTNGSTAQMDGSVEPVAPSKPPVLWATKAGPDSTPKQTQNRRLIDPDDESQAQYQKLISSVAAKDTDEI